MLRAAEATGTAVSFYPVNTQLIPVPPALEPGDMLLLVDYFGIRSGPVRELAATVGRRAILDASMAFFSAPPPGAWWFTSARKFFGLPDGATWAGPDLLPRPEAHNPAVRADHLLLAQVGDPEAGLAAYRANNAALRTDALAAAPLSRHLFARLDLEAARTARTRNFLHLHERLGHHNQLQVDSARINGPLHYPLHLSRAVDLRPWHAAGIFAPRLWPDVLARAGSDPESRMLAEAIVPLPIDQRYTTDDMNELAWRVEQLL